MYKNKQMTINAYLIYPLFRSLVVMRVHGKDAIYLKNPLE